MHAHLKNNHFKNLAFTNLGLDTLHMERRNEEMLKKYFHRKDSKCILFSKNNPSKTTSTLNYDILMNGNQLNYKNLSDLNLLEEKAVFLGNYNDLPLFSAVIEDGEKFDGDQKFENVRKVLPSLNAVESSIVGYAKSLMHYNHNTQFCGCCGSKTVPKEGGLMKRCSNEECKNDIYPRIDPCIICLVKSKCGSKILLANHHRSSQSKLFTCLAGYMQLETIEETVYREVYEEVKVKVENIQYVFSQPWPFPNSLMIGCTANSVAETPIINVDNEELTEAKFFDREEVISMLENRHPLGYIIPMPFSLSHFLIQKFLNKF